MLEVLWHLSNFLFVLFTTSVLLRCWDGIDNLSRGIAIAAMAVSLAHLIGSLLS